MVAEMIDDKELKKRLASRSEIVNRTLKEFDGQKIQEFEKNLRIYNFLYDKLKWTKIYLASINKDLEKKQHSLLMQVLTNETYQSSQNYFQKITLELQKDFYELELVKIGISFVYFQEEYELIRDELNSSNLTDEEEAKHQLTCDLYSISLKMKILQRMGCSFVQETVNDN